MSTEINIYQGEDREVPLQTKYKNGNVRALGTPSEIVVKFPNEDGTEYEAKLTESNVVITDDANGKFKAILSDTVTALLNEGENQDICIEITNGTDTRITKAVGVLNVKAC